MSNHKDRKLVSFSVYLVNSEWFLKWVIYTCIKDIIGVILILFDTLVQSLIEILENIL